MSKDAKEWVIAFLIAAPCVALILLILQFYQLAQLFSNCNPGPCLGAY